MLLILLVASALVAGLGLSRALYSGAAETLPLEKAFAAGVLAFSALTAANWVLALTHTLSKGGLLAASLALAAVGALLLMRNREASPGTPPAPLTTSSYVAVGALVPLFAWTAFVSWRGAILPVLSEDAMIYHFAKALFMVHTRGFGAFLAPDLRLQTYPLNYELLLADVMTVLGSDAYTEWISVVAYLLFGLAVAALTQRWWGDSLLAIAGTSLVALGTPIALLHSGAHKHDLLSTAFGMAGLLWAARWAHERNGRLLFASLAAMALALGTKVPSACLVIGTGAVLVIGGFAAVRRGERPSARIALGTFAVVAYCVVLQGGMPFLANIAEFGSPLGPNVTGAAPAIMQVPRVYWESLWQFPYLILTAPFSPDDGGVFVPWEGTYWFWPRYDLNHSNWGALISFLILAVPFLVWKTRSESPGIALPRERHLILLGGALAAVIPAIVPSPFPGLLIGWARYIVFFPALVAVASVGPLIAGFERAGGRRGRWLSYLLVGTASLYFLVNAVAVGQNDALAPAPYVRWVAQNPGTRVPFRSPFRAAVLVDRLAGPDDVIAFDAAHDTWVYPAWGAAGRREVIFLPPGPGPVEIPERARWVIVDRLSHVIYGNPGLRHLGRDARKFLLRGTPTPEDLRVVSAMLKNPAFRLVFHDPVLNQAVFERVPPQSGLR